MNETVMQLNKYVVFFALIIIAWVIVQCTLFMRLALRFNKKNQLVSKEELKDAVKTGSIAVVGPALNAGVCVLSIVALLGSGVAFFRCGVIGSADYELFIAEAIAKAQNFEIGTAAFTGTQYALVLFCMTMSTFVYFFNVCITLKPLDKMQIKQKKENITEGKKKASFMNDEFGNVMIGTIAIICTWYIYDAGELSSMVAAGAIGVIVTKIVKRNPKLKALSDWSLTLSLILGMVIGQAVTMLVS